MSFFALVLVEKPLTESEAAMSTFSDGNLVDAEPAARNRDILMGSKNINATIC